MLRKDRIVFFDVDNTIVDGYTQKYFISYLFRKKIINVGVLFLSYVWFFLYKLNLVRDVGRAMSFYVYFFGGWNKKKMSDLIDDFFDNYIINNFFSDIIKIINKHKDRGDRVILISTSITPIVKRIADHLAIEDYISTELKIENDLYAGEINGRALAGEEKLVVVKKLLKTYVDVETYFYSDHFSDEALLSYVDKPNVVNPDKILYNKAKKNNWNIIECKK